MFKRFVIMICNILFPPIAVAMLTGMNEDLIFNCVLFLLAVIPSHVHGFYISLTYFNRKRKVRKGVYPGKPRRMIYSSKVNNGGASRREMDILKREKEEGKKGGLMPSLSKRNTQKEMVEEPRKEGLTDRLSRRVTESSWVKKLEGEADNYWEEPVSPVSSQSSRRVAGRSRRYEDESDDDRRTSRRSSRRRAY